MHSKTCITVLLAVSLFQGCSAQKPKMVALAKAESHPKGVVDSSDKVSEHAQKPAMKKLLRKKCPI